MTYPNSCLLFFCTSTSVPLSLVTVVLSLRFPICYLFVSVLQNTPSWFVRLCMHRFHGLLSFFLSFYKFFITSFKRFKLLITFGCLGSWTYSGFVLFCFCFLGFPCSTILTTFNHYFENFRQPLFFCDTVSFYLILWCLKNSI